jgi:dihydroflavonol-4-reductase
MLTNTANNCGIILVTGASGYIASHCIKILLDQGFNVRGTVRSLARKEKYQFLYEVSPNSATQLTLVEAELENVESWRKAVEGCQYVLHVASPIPPYVPKDENEIIKPAVEGTINVLNASLESGVKKVVVTSSCLTLFFGNDGKCVSEEDWSDTNKCSHYPKSKVLAERAAWEFYEKNKEKIQITTVLPSLVLGPSFTVHGNTSEGLMKEIMNNTYPGIPTPDVNYSIVDVRDVAQGHVNALFNENSNGKRYILSGSNVTNEGIVNIFNDEFGKYGYVFPSKKVTAEDIKASGHPLAQRIIPMLGKNFQLTNERSIKELNMTYRTTQQSVIDMGLSLIKLGLVEDKTKN